ncbi:MAG: TIGR03915 family putative DNA repair protein [Ruthenibacterium sp.]
MSDCTNVEYLYDGTFEGMLCCVFESVYRREIPADIVAQDTAEASLFPQRCIVTEPNKAMRVYQSLPKKLGSTAAELVQTVFLSCARDKEMKILRFLLFGYRHGMQTMHQLSHPVVTPMLTAQLALKNEVHLLLGFLRFSDFEGALVAHISPKNYVLPFLKEHFCTRYACEDFLIYDTVHHAALVYQNGLADIIALASLEMPAVSETEAQYRALWQRFYQTISIAARENPKCRMTHMPKRYWENMLEVREELRRMPPSLQAELVGGTNELTA